MASHMGVQTFATERNSQVEFFIHLLLENFFIGLEQERSLTNVNIGMQKQYTSLIASDIWDHHITATQKNGRGIEVWCQTTCYKGNGTGLPEPNKTYEVRETLVEGLSIRQKFKTDKATDYRTIHFTVGDSAYTYKWFMDLKASVYDKSIYIGTSGYDIFQDIHQLFGGIHTETDKRQAFNDCLKHGSRLAQMTLNALNELKTWWNYGANQSSVLGNLQWDIIDKQITRSSAMLRDFTQVRGQNIKGRTNAIILSDDPSTEDLLIRKTAVKLLAKNPFLSIAIEIIAGWEEFIDDLQKYHNEETNMASFISRLWNIDIPRRLVVRRLLLRIHTRESVAYVQDLNIGGITEHNLYTKDHTEDQYKRIINQITQNLEANGINNIRDLISQIRANGKKLINQARWFEGKNGTELKPSFDYVELALEENGYRLVTPSKVGVNVRGYHAEISKENVRPYTNLKAVVSESGQVLCLIKAKFFRIQEFARRCKEEAFVGLTLLSSFENDEFSDKSSIPLVMFIDMPTNCTVPTHAIKRLMSFGWHPVFSIAELTKYMEELEAK